MGMTRMAAPFSVNLSFLQIKKTSPPARAILMASKNSEDTSEVEKTTRIYFLATQSLTHSGERRPFGEASGQLDDHKSDSTRVDKAQISVSVCVKV